MRFVAPVVVLVATTGCTGGTRENRIYISQHTKDLAAEIKADPESKSAAAAMDELLEILNGNWRFGRSQACYVLDDLGPLAAPAVDDLIRAAHGPDSFVRQDAIRGLRNIGPAAAPAVDLLTGIVASSLKTDPPTASLRALYAIDALGSIGEPALVAVPVLENACRAADDIFAERAQKALSKLKSVNDDGETAGAR